MTELERAVDRYMSEQISFGGEMMSRAAMYQWFEKEGYPRRAAELWDIGYHNITPAKGNPTRLS